VKTWIKLYTEILDDYKLSQLSDGQYRVMMECFALAGRTDEEGYIGKLPEISWKLRRPLEELRVIFPVLADANILTPDEDGSWYVTHFAERNSSPPSDEPEAVKERVQRYRQRKRQERNGNATALQGSGNADVTPLEGEGEGESEGEGEEESHPRDFLGDVYAGKVEGLDNAGIADPNQDELLYSRYGDEALNILVDSGGQFTRNKRANDVLRAAILTLAETPGFIPRRWETSIQTCIKGGVSPRNIQCMIDTYNAGGNYQDMQARKRANGGIQTKPPEPDRMAAGLVKLPPDMAEEVTRGAHQQATGPPAA